MGRLPATHPLVTLSAFVGCVEHAGHGYHHARPAVYRLLVIMSALVGGAHAGHGYDHNSHCPAINCWRGSVGDLHGSDTRAAGPWSCAATGAQGLRSG